MEQAHPVGILHAGEGLAQRRGLVVGRALGGGQQDDLSARGGGTIVNVSSNATRGIHRVPYSAAKGGVNAITQSLAMEMAGRNIRVVATAPGGTEAPPRRVPRNAEGDSAAEKAWMAEVVTQVKQSAFMRRYGTIEEQAAPILCLASDEASYITGSGLPVAGGDLG